MIWILLTLASILIALDILLIIGWKFNFKDNTHPVENWPGVSIMVAARNEEGNIEGCLRSLLNLDYPLSKLEILVGDDGSTDQTFKIVQNMASEYNHIQLFSIKNRTVDGNGKANVLAQLAQHAKGSYYLITDADITVTEDWVKAMLSGLTENTGLVTGTSVVDGQGWLASMQRIDWLNATGMLKVVSDLNIPVTSMGNNMLVSREAYEAVGGYESLPFSVTEDLELFNHIKRKYGTINLFSKEVKNRSKAQNSILDLLKQRKRWMKGAFGLPVLMIILLLLQSSVLILLVFLLAIEPTLALIIILLKFTLRYVFVSMVGGKIEEKVNLISSFAFEIFNMIFSLMALGYYVFSGPIVWKERKY